MKWCVNRWTIFVIALRALREFTQFTR